MRCNLVAIYFEKDDKGMQFLTNHMQLKVHLAKHIIKKAIHGVVC